MADQKIYASGGSLKRFKNWILSKYYNKDATDSLLAGKSDTSHIHDERYYTETEMDSMLAAKLTEPTENADIATLLWNWLHRYGYSHKPSDTSNLGWNAEGFYISVFNGTGIDYGMPLSWGQLINIPCDRNNESMQIFIGQNNGGVWTRGGNSTIPIESRKWALKAFNNVHDIGDQYTLAQAFAVGTVAVDGIYTSGISRSYTVPFSGLFHGFLIGSSGQVIVTLDGKAIEASIFHAQNSLSFHIPVRAEQIITFSAQSDTNQVSYNNWLFPYYYEY